jgi:hypothetical protein
MRGLQWSVVALCISVPGCQSAPARRPIASAEPTLTAPGEQGTIVGETTPPKTASWVDRHPLFTKPRQYYDNSGSNKVVKTAAAAVIGVPAGIVGEIKQIVVGAPPEPRY